MRKKVATFLFKNSLFLVGGAVIALIWANLDPHAYHHFLHEPILYGLNLHFIVNDFLMALFFGIAAKEVRESFLKGGELRDPRKAGIPLLATLGGVLVPAAVYLSGAWMVGELSTHHRGWAVPCATDIAFSVMAARLIFGERHSAVTFLLLLAIVDDAIGLIILAVAYPQNAMNYYWLVGVAAAVGWGFGMSRMWIHSFWWYLLGPGLLSWFSFYQAGLHPALGLVPIIPTMPHAKTDLGHFAREEWKRHDTLNEFEHWWKNPVQLMLGLFGLCNSGVVLSSVGTATWLVLAGLLIGKPVGITLFALLGRVCGLRFPDGIGVRQLVVLGMIAGMGFTVALFVAVAAFPAGAVQDAAKMGALGSFGAAGLAWVLARALGVGRSLEEAMAEFPLVSELSTEAELEPEAAKV